MKKIFRSINNIKSFFEKNIIQGVPKVMITEEIHISSLFILKLNQIFFLFCREEY
jgi:hypothetical protein